MVLPQAPPQVARAIQRRSDGEPFQKCRMQTSIEQCEACSKDAGVRLDAANQYTVHTQISKILDSSRRWEIAVLYKNAVSGYETFISLSGFPSQLSFEGRYRFIMPLDGGHAWEYGA